MAVHIFFPRAALSSIPLLIKYSNQPKSGAASVAALWPPSHTQFHIIFSPHFRGFLSFQFLLATDHRLVVFPIIDMVVLVVVPRRKERWCVWNTPRRRLMKEAYLDSRREAGWRRNCVMDATVTSDDCCSLEGARGGRSGLAKDVKISF